MALLASANEGGNQQAISMPSPVGATRVCHAPPLGERRRLGEHGHLIKRKQLLLVHILNASHVASQGLGHELTRGGVQQAAMHLMVRAVAE